jgi:colanic acid/amylovoran biosynthesis glycosyltransferase
MRKVLHYKTNYLNKSETFIDRLVRNHREFVPVIMCCKKRDFADGLKIHELPKTGFKAQLNRMAFHLNMSLPWFKTIINHEKPDLIHAHFGYDSYKLLTISKNTGIPLVTSFYGSDVSRLPAETWWKSRYRRLAEYGDAFIAASDYMKTQLIQLGFPQNKIHVARFGLNTVELDFFEGQRDSTAIMMVGRLVEKKGFEFGIKAVSKLIRNGRKLKLNIYGDGPLMEPLQELVMQLETEEAIEFHGFQPVETIMQAHHMNTLLLAPSIAAADGDMEGLPNTILEAMAKGTLVVASRHAAIPEVVIHGNTGFLTNEKDLDGIAKTLDSVLDKLSDLNSIRKLARAAIERDYNIQKMAADVEKIYKMTLPGS